MSYLKHIFQTVRKESPSLYWIVMVLFIFAIVSVLGSWIDDRTLMGVNVWMKPIKFSISTAIYVLTVGFLVTLYPFSERKKNFINNIVAWTLLLEIVLILFQASRGVLSHYNISSPLDGLIFAAMGILIATNVLIMGLFIIDTIRLKLNTPKLLQWAILLGWLTVFFGSWIGGQMIGRMSHNVGVADGGAGLPFVNWSTVAGDLRVAHFFALHGLQIIPIFAYFILNKWKTSTRNQLILITVFVIAYAVWIAYVFYQAKLGIPLIQQ